MYVCVDLDVDVVKRISLLDDHQDTSDAACLRSELSIIDVVRGLCRRRLA